MFVAAMAAYLRLVSTTARDKIEAILAGKDALWSLDYSYTRERLKILGRTRTAIRWVTHLYFFLAFMAASRLCVLAAKPGIDNTCIYYWDLSLVGMLAISLGAMWLLHIYNRHRDDLNYRDMVVQRVPLLADIL